MNCLVLQKLKWQMNCCGIKQFYRFFVWKVSVASLSNKLSRCRATPCCPQHVILYSNLSSFRPTTLVDWFCWLRTSAQVEFWRYRRSHDSNSKIRATIVSCKISGQQHMKKETFLCILLTYFSNKNMFVDLAMNKKKISAL